MESTDFRVGELADRQPQPTQYEASPFRKAKVPDPLHFEVNVEAHSGDRQKKHAYVQVNIPGFSPVKLYCDEQKPVGDDTAPPPLAYFSAGVALCLLTHLTDILTARKIDVAAMKIEQRTRFKTNLSTMRTLGHTTEGECEGIEYNVMITSDEDPAVIRELFEEAQNACMAHHALRNPIPWSARLLQNEDVLLEESG